MNLLQQIKNIAEEEGFATITGFVNHWIQNGGSFYTLRDWLMLEKGLIKSRITIWKSLRPFLTLPYSREDQFWYKWNSIAKAKGFKDIPDMVRKLNLKKTSRKQVAKEFAILITNVDKFVYSLAKKRKIYSGPQQITQLRPYIKKERHKVKRNKNGMVRCDSSKIWDDKLKKYGFRSLRDAVWRLRLKKYNQTQMAQLFGVTARTFRNRLRRNDL